MPIDFPLGRGRVDEKLVQLGDHTEEARKQALAGWSERQSACRADDEPSVDTLFQPGNPLRNDRRRYIELTSGRGETPESGHHQERVDVQDGVDGLPR
jgi:hypothetical protein